MVHEQREVRLIQCIYPFSVTTGTNPSGSDPCGLHRQGMPGPAQSPCGQGVSGCCSQSQPSPAHLQGSVIDAAVMGTESRAGFQCAPSRVCRKDSSERPIPRSSGGSTNTACRKLPSAQLGQSWLHPGCGAYCEYSQVRSGSHRFTFDARVACGNEGRLFGPRTLDQCIEREALSIPPSAPNDSPRQLWLGCPE